MEYVIGAVLVLIPIALIVGALTGRVRVTSCCGVADPRRDLRMHGAFEDDDS